MSECFVESVNLLGALEGTARSLLDTLTDENVIETIKAKARFRIAARLLKEAKTAMTGHLEYSYPLLQEHLLVNLTNVDHVEVDDSLTTVKVFDTRIGGDAADLEGGQYKSAHDDKTRSLGWRFGIFMPAREGGAGFQWTAKSKPKIIADYEAVIQERLAYWGPKAPYWFFLEHGNTQLTSRGTPYPMFGATDFIAKTAQAAPDILASIIRETEEDIEAGAEITLEEAEFMGEKPTIRVDTKEIGPGWAKETFRSSRGKVFPRYRTPKGTWGTAESMIASAD